MTTMGIGQQHYMNRMHKWKVWRFVKTVLSQVFRHHEHEKLKRALDKSIIFIGILSPIMTIPQIYKIFANQSAEGLSLISWVTYIIVGAFWLTYGIAHKERPIILVNVGWMIVNSGTLAGIVLYG
jgi:uncharacterized protein with PQ loop repeat